MPPTIVKPPPSGRGRRTGEWPMATTLMKENASAALSVPATKLAVSGARPSSMFATATRASDMREVQKPVMRVTSVVKMAVSHAKPGTAACATTRGESAPAPVNRAHALPRDAVDSVEKFARGALVMPGQMSVELHGVQPDSELGEPTVDGGQPTHVELSVAYANGNAQLSTMDVQSAADAGGIVAPNFVESAPGGHENCVHAACPVKNVPKPSGQALQDDREVEPGAVRNVLTGQASHLMRPTVGPYVPGLQGIQPDALLIGLIAAMPRASL
jgi:hypothetical protein